jgi:hypothetical protein
MDGRKKEEEWRENDFMFIVYDAYLKGKNLHHARKKRLAHLLVKQFLPIRSKNLSENYVEQINGTEI